RGRRRMSNTEIKLNQGRVVSMRELSQNTSGVIAEIIEANEPTFLTKRGQFIAAIVPLQPSVVERRVLSGLLDQLRTGEVDEGAVTSEMAAAMNEVNLEPRRRPRSRGKSRGRRT